MSKATCTVLDYNRVHGDRDDNPVVSSLHQQQLERANIRDNNPAANAILEAVKGIGDMHKQYNWPAELELEPRGDFSNFAKSRSRKIADLCSALRDPEASGQTSETIEDGVAAVLQYGLRCALSNYKPKVKHKIDRAVRMMGDYKMQEHLNTALDLIILRTQNDSDIQRRTKYFKGRLKKGIRLLPVQAD